MKNQIDIYNPEGKIIKTHIFSSNCVRKFSLMNEDSMTLRFHSPAVINFPVGSYVETPYGRFYITQEQPGKWNESTGIWNYELKFDAYYLLWVNRILRYTILNDKGDVISTSETSFVLTASIDIQARVIMNSLKALGFQYNESDFRVEITDSLLSGKAKLVRYENLSVLGGIQAIAEAFDCEWWVRENTIYFGKCENKDTSFTFKAGDNVSSISFQQAKSEIPNRLYVFGSTRNLPADYREANGFDTIGGVVNKRLMLPSDKPYIQTDENLTEDQLVEQVVILDDVYPKTELTVSEDPQTYTAPGKDESGNATSETFYRIKYGDSFPFSENYVLPGEELHIIFRSGNLNGMDFGVKFNPKGVNEKDTKGEINPEAQVFEIVANSDYGRSLPDDILKPQKGDEFILYGWDSTKIVDLGLIAEAEKELLEEGNKVLEEYSKDLTTCTCHTAWNYMKALLSKNEQPKPGDTVTIIDAAHFGTEGRKSRVIGYEYKLDKDYAEYIYTCGESISVKRLDSIEKKIEGLAKSGQNLQLQNSLDFLSKRYADRTPYKLSSDKGFEIGNYMAGVSGAMIGRDAVSGQTFGELDRLLVRVKAYFETLTIINAETLAGKQYITPGGGIKCIIVKETSNGYRCFFLSQQDGEKTYTKIIKGDQAICQEFNVEPGMSKKVSSHYFWRLVTDVNNDAYTDENTGNHYGYIELSKSECDNGSDVPKEGDVICQFGYRGTDNPERQTAMVFSTVDTDAPSIKMFSGINSFSLDDKAIISFGRQPLTNQVYFRLGNSTADQYLGYTQNSGLEVAGRISAKSTIDNDSLDDYVNNAADKAAKKYALYALDMDNEVAGVACNSAGTVIGQLPSTNMTVFKGGSVDSGWSFRKATNGEVGCKASISGSTLTITSLTADNASITVQATKSNMPTLTATMNVYKVRPGANGSNGTNGAPAVVYSIEPSVDNITKAMTGELSESSISCSVYKTTGNSSRVLTSEKTLTCYKVKADGTTQTTILTHTNGVTSAQSVTEDTKAVIFELTDVSTVLDRERVPVLSDASDLDIGGRNLLLRSYDGITSSDYLIRAFPLSIAPTAGDVYTFTLWGKLAATKSKFRIYNSSGVVGLADLEEVENGKYQAVFKWEKKNSDGYIAKDTHIEIYVLFNSQVGESTVHRVKLEKGNVGTDWTPAPEDIENTVKTFDYLKAALKENTLIDGGLVLSSLIKLGQGIVGGDQATIATVRAGMNGTWSNDLGGRTIASWWGGDVVDRFDKRNQAMDPVPANAASALVRMDGSAYFAKGNIGFNADGSGWLGGEDNIKFTPDGKMTFGNGIKINISSSEKGLKETLESFANLLTFFIPEKADGTPTNWSEGDSVIDRIKVTKGFYSDSFISARGANPFEGTVSTGLNESDLATYLTTNNYAKKSDIPSLTGYLSITDGDNRYLGKDANAKTASKLAANTTFTAWGQTFFENGVPKNVSGNMTGVGSISMNNSIIQSLKASSWAISKNAYSPNMRADNRVAMRLGKTGSNYNTGYVSYHHKEDGSTNNYISLGLWGRDEILNVLGSGNVGIGTTTPYYKFDVNGTARVKQLIVDGGANEVKNILIENIQIKKLNDGLYFNDNNNGNSISINHVSKFLGVRSLAWYEDNWTDIYGNSRPWYGYSNIDNNETGVYGTVLADYRGLSLKTAAGLLSVKNNGNVGINTDNPSDKLDVAGNIRCHVITVGNSSMNGAIELYHSTPYIDFHFDRSSADYTTRIIEEASGRLKIVGTLRTTVGLYSDGYVSARGQNTSSDERLKNILGNVDLNVKQIANAPSVSFAWKSDGTRDVGSIAQYWKDISPLLTPKDINGNLTLQYGKAALLSVISVAKEMTALEERLRSIENENKELKHRIEILERRLL